MTQEQMESVFANLFKYSRAKERECWKRNPSAFAERAASEATRGWAFLLPKEPVARAAATANHIATREAIRVAGLAWIQSSSPLFRVVATPDRGTRLERVR